MEFNENAGEMWLDYSKPVQGSDLHGAPQLLSLHVRHDAHVVWSLRISAGCLFLKACNLTRLERMVLQLPVYILYIYVCVCVYVYIIYIHIIIHIHIQHWHVSTLTSEKNKINPAATHPQRLRSKGRDSPLLWRSCSVSPGGQSTDSYGRNKNNKPIHQSSPFL